MQKQTWESRGIEYASELARQNITDLLEILQWNRDNDIYFYRCTSKLVPWNSQFELSAVPDYERIQEIAKACGDLIRANDMRLTFHPDYWCKLASESEETVQNSLTAIEYHADWLDLLGLDRSPYYSINVHIGATYGDKAATAERFRDAIAELSPGARQRLTVENDDKEGLWSVPELVDEVGDPTGVPVVFDYHHHQFTDRGLSYREAFDRARSTWEDIRPVGHYSNPAQLYGADSRPQAHADAVADIPAWFRDAADVMIEAGAKEQALLDFRAGIDCDSNN